MRRGELELCEIGRRVRIVVVVVRAAAGGGRGGSVVGGVCVFILAADLPRKHERLLHERFPVHLAGSGTGIACCYGVFTF